VVEASALSKEVKGSCSATFTASIKQKTEKKVLMRGFFIALNGYCPAITLRKIQELRTALYLCLKHIGAFARQILAAAGVVSSNSLKEFTILHMNFF
jgi:hypothetical protein